MNRNTITLILCVITLFSLSSAAQDIIEYNLQEITRENILQIQHLNTIEVAPINNISWSPNGDRIVIATTDGLWMLNIFSETLELVISETVHQVSFLGNTGRLIASIENSSIIIDADTYAIIQELPTRFHSISHDGTMLAFGGLDNITIFELGNGTVISEIPLEHSDLCEYVCSVQDVIFNNSGSYIAFSSATPTLQSAIIEIETGERLFIDVGFLGLSFSPDDTLLVSRSGEPGYLSDETYITSIESGEILTTIELFGTYTPAIFNRDGNLLVVVGVESNVPNIDEALTEILFFDVQQLLNIVDADSSLALDSIVLESSIASINFSPDYRILAISEIAGRISLWGVLAE